MDAPTRNLIQEVSLVYSPSQAGKKKSITIPVSYVGEGEFHGARRGYMTTFSIKRSDFGMTYGVKQNVLGDDVHLTVSLELVQPE